MAALARRKEMAALARSEHERAARSLPAAALPQRAFSENTTKRDIPTFVRARIREFEAVLPRPFYLGRSGARLAVVAGSRPWRHGAALASTASEGAHRARSQAARECVVILAAEKSSHTMRVANADSDWDIHCFDLPRDPAVRPAASLFTGVAAMACEWG